MSSPHELPAGVGAPPGTPGWLPPGPDLTDGFQATETSDPYTLDATDGPTVPADERATRTLVQVRRWLIAAIVLALVGGFAAGQVYYLKAHTVTRYEQTAPGETVTVGDATYQLLTLKTSPTLPGYGDEPTRPEEGEAFVVATLHVTPHVADPGSIYCSLDLLAEPHHSWEPTSYSTVPLTDDQDFCELLAQDQQATVYLAWTIPASEVPAVTGVVVEPYTGAPQVILRPPA